MVIGAGGLGQMAIQVLKALTAATPLSVDTSAEKLEIAKKMGADEGLLSGDDAVKRVKDLTSGQGAELVLDLVAVNPTLAMAAQMARVLGSLTIVGVGNAAMPVNFSSPPHECAVAAPFWGSIPELIEVITLAHTGKIQMLVEHFSLERAAEAYHLLHDGKIQGRANVGAADSFSEWATTIVASTSRTTTSPRSASATSTPAVRRAAGPTRGDAPGRGLSQSWPTARG